MVRKRWQPVWIVTVTAVNDEVVSLLMIAVCLAQEPQIRLDAAPEHGTVQHMNADGEWEDMVVGTEYPADAQVQFVPDTDDCPGRYPRYHGGQL